MRLIDADALDDVMMRLNFEENRGITRSEYKLIDSVLFEFPTIEAQPKTGKWIYDGDCYICNQCKSAFSWWADSQTSNYCPNCGADMRGKQNG